MKPILPDPITLHRAGLNTLHQASILVHIGRCGIQGTTVPSMAEVVGLNNNTVHTNVGILEDLKLVVHYAKKNSQGRAKLYVVTKRGWELLTTPGDFTLFPDATSAMKPLSAP